MKAYYSQLKRAFEARSFNERVLMLAAILAVVAYAWMVLVHDRLSATQSDVDRQIAVVNGQIRAQEQSMEEMRVSYQSDPNAFARERLLDLREETAEIDQRLEELYGQLITPRQMARVLVSILRRETSLRLVNLENSAPQAMFEASGNFAANRSSREGQLRVFRHGLTLELRGTYMETLRYLKSLEALETNFFWETLSFDSDEYPQAAVVLSIFTLSTEESWIGG